MWGEAGAVCRGGGNGLAVGVNWGIHPSAGVSCVLPYRGRDSA